MHFARLVPAAVLFPLLAGCGYIHFGRLPEPATLAGDSALAQAYSNLGTEHKILKQELALARKEGDALRKALERTGGGSIAPDSAGRLNEVARELAMLRASHARLQAERDARPGPEGAATQGKLTELEERLAASLRGYTQLQEENARLKASLEKTRGENLALAAQLKTAVTEKDQAQANLAQLNTELLAQKEARLRAEQATAATRAQLSVVMAQNRDGAAPASQAGGVGALRLAKAPPADASPTAELRTSPERLKAGGSPDPSVRPPPASGEVSTPPRSALVHVVRAGDTLESIAREHYQDPERWRAIYEANSALLSDGRPITPGMELRLPPPQRVPGRSVSSP